MKRFYFVILLLVMTMLSLSSIVKAELLPKSPGADRHVRIATYDANQVYRLSTMQGYTTAIQLSDQEKIISVNLGDSSAWLVTVQDNIINLKPISDNPDTNMNVVSNRGTYQFFLTAPPVKLDSSGELARKPHDDTVFLLRFHYKEPPNTEHSYQVNSGLNELPLNMKYTARGSSSVTPISVFDNGSFTFFDFGNRKDIPAIFSVDSNGQESLINYHIKGKYVVVETIAKQFTLRNGSQVAAVFNEVQWVQQLL